MRLATAKLTALAAFNIAALAAIVYLLTYTGTRYLQDPFTPLRAIIEQSHPYSLANRNISYGAIALWLGLVAVWIFGNLSIHAVKERVER